MLYNIHGLLHHGIVLLLTLLTSPGIVILMVLQVTQRPLTPEQNIQMGNRRKINCGLSFHMHSVIWCGILYQDSFTRLSAQSFMAINCPCWKKGGWVCRAALWLNRFIQTDHKFTVTKASKLANLSIHTTLSHDKKEPMKTVFLLSALSFVFWAWGLFGVCMWV